MKVVGKHPYYRMRSILNLRGARSYEVALYNSDLSPIWLNIKAKFGGMTKVTYSFWYLLFFLGVILMAKKKKNIFKISSIENTLRHMPKYNAFQGGYGSHGDKSYNRRKNKEEFRKQLREVL